MYKIIEIMVDRETIVGRARTLEASQRKLEKHERALNRQLGPEVLVEVAIEYQTESGEWRRIDEEEDES